MIYPLAHTAVVSMLPYITFSSVFVFIYLFLRLINKTSKAMGELDDLFPRKFCHLGSKMSILKGEEKTLELLNLPSCLYNSETFVLILGFNNYLLWNMASQKVKIWQKEFRYSQSISLYLHLFQQQQKKAHPLLLMKYYIWKEKLLLKNICMASLCIFRVFFLEWLKSCSSSVLFIIVLTMVLVMESLQAGTQKILDLNACK